jgi:hypothetical protein
LICLYFIKTIILMLDSTEPISRHNTFYNKRYTN